MKHEKNNVVLIIIGTLLLLCCLIGSASAFSGEGSGTEDEPYLINTPEEFQEMKDDVTAWYQLGYEIDCSALTSWTPIGTTSAPFKGHLLGDGWTISNLTFTTSGDNKGIFGAIGDGAYFGSVTFRNINHTSTSGNNIGIFCGIIDDNSNPIEIYSVNVYDSVITANGNNVGAFVGCVNSCSTNSTIEDTTFANITITSTGNNIGGVFGNIESDMPLIFFMYCTDNTINAPQSTNVGGFVGRIGNCKVTEDNIIQLDGCNITGLSKVGGFVGCVDGGEFSISNIDCHLITCVIKALNNYAGGIVGYAGVNSIVKITEGSAYTEGLSIDKNTIYSVSDCAGGVIGYADSSATCELDGLNFEWCSVNSQTNVGGYIGNGNGASVTIYEPYVRETTLLSTASNGIVAGIYNGSTSNVTITDGKMEFVNIYGNTIIEIAPSGTWSGTTTSNISNTPNINIKANSTGVSTYNAPSQKISFNTRIGNGSEERNGLEGNNYISTGDNYYFVHTDGVHTYTDSAIVYSYPTSGVNVNWTNREFGTYTTTLTITNDLGSTTVTFTTEVQPDFLGSGTEADPYQISDLSQFLKLKDYSNGKKFYFVLMNDIDCSSLTSWNNLGDLYSVIDGNGKTIKNLTTGTGNDCAIFNSMKNASIIKNCTFDNITNNIADNNDKGLLCNSVSGVVKFNNVIVQNSTLTNKKSNVGIFVGSAYSTVEFTNCKCKNVTISGIYYNVGGFVGYGEKNKLTFTNCVCENSSITSAACSGAFVGYQYNKWTVRYMTFKNCEVNNCSLYANGSAGGFVGKIYQYAYVTLDDNCIVENSYIRANNSDCGGFIGTINASNSTILISESSTSGNGAKIINCCIKSGTNVGGIFGEIESPVSCKIDGCVVNQCSINGVNNIGGVIGQINQSTNDTFINNPTVTNSTIVSTSISGSSGIVAGICPKSSTVFNFISNGTIQNVNIYGRSDATYDVAPLGYWTGTTTSNITHNSVNLKTDSTGTSSFSASTNKVTFQVTVGGVNGYEGSTYLSNGNPFSWSHTDGTHTYTDTVAIDITGKATIDWTGREYGIYTSTLTIENELGSTTVTFSNIPIYLPLIINVSSSASKIQPSSELKLMCYASGGLGATTYEWKQGTTTISTEQNPTITVPEEEGTYTYSVTVTNATTSQTKTGEITVKVVKVWNDTEETVTKNMTASFILVLLIPLTMAGLIIFMIIRTGEMDYKSLIGIGVLIVVTIIIVILAGSIDGTVIEGMEKLR